MAAKKRQRNRSVYLCPKCKSPFSKAHSTEYYSPKSRPEPAPQTQKKNSNSIGMTIMPSPVNIIPNNEDWEYKLTFYCLSCKDEATYTTRDSTDLRQMFDTHIETNSVKMKSPFEVELKFKSIQVDKKTMRRASNKESIALHGMPAFFAYCEDRSGLVYRFGGKSARDIIYGALKDKWFKTRICVQNFTKTNNSRTEYWHRRVGSNNNTVVAWRQTPRIIGEIELV